MVEGMSSNIADVNSRVPQGTVLGPLLFLAYINELPDVVTPKVKLFADDFNQPAIQSNSSRTYVL